MKVLRLIYETKFLISFTHWLLVQESHFILVLMFIFPFKPYSVLCEKKTFYMKTRIFFLWLSRPLISIKPLIKTCLPLSHPSPHLVLQKLPMSLCNSSHRVTETEGTPSKTTGDIKDPYLYLVHLKPPRGSRDLILRPSNPTVTPKYDNRVLNRHVSIKRQRPFCSPGYLVGPYNLQSPSETGLQ